MDYKFFIHGLYNLTADAYFDVNFGSIRLQSNREQDLYHESQFGFCRERFVRQFYAYEIKTFTVMTIA